MISTFLGVLDMAHLEIALVLSGADVPTILRVLNHLDFGFSKPFGILFRDCHVVQR